MRSVFTAEFRDFATTNTVKNEKTKKQNRICSNFAEVDRVVSVRGDADVGKITGDDDKSVRRNARNTPVTTLFVVFCFHKPPVSVVVNIR